MTSRNRSFHRFQTSRITTAKYLEISEIWSIHSKSDSGISSECQKSPFQYLRLFTSNYNLSGGNEKINDLGNPKFLKHDIQILERAALDWEVLKCVRAKSLQVRNKMVAHITSARVIGSKWIEGFRFTEALIDLKIHKHANLCNS